MPDSLQSTLELAKDAGLALTDPAYSYALLVNAAVLLTVAGLLVLVGLIATHGKSHGTRFSSMAVFAFAALAGISAYLLRPDLAAGTPLESMLMWSWIAPLLAALSLFATMQESPKPRAVGLACASLLALGATVFAGMLSVSNARALNPDQMAWLDAPPIEQVKPARDEETPKNTEVVEVLDTNHRR